ncbi:MAG TPA: Lrp/AsnC family transcriptional regulator [Dehalococcoidia bacterium]|nr:Lrp/AsnC family transcriptional regulator [Dehalococcoidia bacterium]
MTGQSPRAILFAIMDDLDLRLISELTKDARQSSAELSRTLNVSETTIRRRIQYMEEQGIITFTAILNPAKLGYSIIAIIALEVELGKIDKVSESLANCPNVRYVSLCTGNHDLFIGTWFHSSSELTQFVKDYLAGVPGIRKSETFVILDVKKDEVGWLRSLEQMDTSG